MLAILENRTYRHLFLAQVIALVGTGLATVALGLGVEVAIVSSMHVFRIAVVVIAAPMAFRLLGLKRRS